MLLKNLYRNLSLPLIWAGLFFTLFLFASCHPRPVKLLMGGSGWNQVVIIDKATKEIEWSYPLEADWECNSVSCTSDGNVVFSYKKGARMVNRNHEIIWDIPAPENCEMQTARVLPDGHILLAWTGHPAVILETDQNGKELSRTTFETGIAHPHAQFRQINKNASGNYLIPLMGGTDILELTPEGKKIHSSTFEGNYFTLLHEQGNVCWIACGDRHALLLADLKTGEIIKRYGEDDIPGVKLFFVAGLNRSENGGLYICNWQGHAPQAREANSPQLFELDTEGRVVWTLNDNERFGMISDVCIIK